MSLVPDYEDSSSSSKDSSSSSLSSSSSSDSAEKLSSDSNTDQQQTKPIKLPTPSFLLTDNNQENVEKLSSSSSSSSVFKNPYAEAESAKEAILQKHVKMVQNKSNITAINGRHICWNYRKMGRCRFGHNCKYAHDSDLQINTCQISNNDDGDIEQKQQLSHKKQTMKIITEKKEKRRKRPGLSDTVTPSKRVVKNYYKLKQQS